jgi:hypothetical protein
VGHGPGTAGARKPEGRKKGATGADKASIFG